jgi:leucyl aminopeptidase
VIFWINFRHFKTRIKDMPSALHSALCEENHGPFSPLWAIDEASWPDFKQNLSAYQQNLAQVNGFQAKEGTIALLTDAQGALNGVLFGLGAHADHADPFLLGKLHDLLPEGDYELIACGLKPDLAILGFALGCYRFERYKKASLKKIRLKCPKDVDANEITRIVKGVTLGRNLINTPANDCSPQDLEHATRALASEHGAHVHVITGDDLLTHHFPMIHAVGRASLATPDRAPRLLDLNWLPQNTDPAHLLSITLVGKGRML